MSRLHGLLAAVVTPFTTDGEGIDEPALRELVGRTIEGGVHGVVPCGSTGEFAALSHDERRLVVEIVVDETAGRVPVVPHTGAMTTREAVSLSRHAESLGAEGILLVAPYYEPLTHDEVVRYYREVARAVGLDVMIYNYPAATGVNLSPAEVADLARAEPNIRYVKDTSGDFGQAALLIHEFGDAISTFVGLDTLYLSSLLEGAAGSVLGTATVIPNELVAIYDAVEEGDWSEAKAVWDSVYPLLQFLVSFGYVPGLKSASEILGWPLGRPRPPSAPLAEPRLSELRGILSALRSSSAQPVRSLS
jgi:4-hydroxy-tetrahydrodipicolinate synthase